MCDMGGGGGGARGLYNIQMIYHLLLPYCNCLKVLYSLVFGI